MSFSRISILKSYPLCWKERLVCPEPCPDRIRPKLPGDGKLLQSFFSFLADSPLECMQQFGNRYGQSLTVRVWIDQDMHVLGLDDISDQADFEMRLQMPQTVDGDLLDVVVPEKGEPAIS